MVLGFSWVNVFTMVNLPAGPCSNQNGYQMLKSKSEVEEVWLMYNNFVQTVHFKTVLRMSSYCQINPMNGLITNSTLNWH